MTDVMNTRVPVTEIDNRDYRTTWIWISDHEYIEVDPVELYRNTIENNPDYKGTTS